MVILSTKDMDGRREKGDAKLKKKTKEFKQLVDLLKVIWKFFV